MVTVSKDPPVSVITPNSSLSLICTATGLGLQSVLWTKESDGSRLDDNSDDGITVSEEFHNDSAITNVLRFSAVTGSQQDTYRCSATSTAGSNYHLVEISLAGLPGAPPPPTLSLLNVVVVTVSWQSSTDTGNLPIDHFQINYGPSGDGSPRHLELPANQTEHVFSLLLATSYYFTVAAGNEQGRGPFSEQNSITTNSTAPGDVTLTVSNVTTNAVLLSWLPLAYNDTGGSTITGYNITYYTEGSEGMKHYRIITVDSVAGDSYWLTGLVDNTPYHMMMCAMNDNGCGDRSSPVDFVTQLGLPGSVSNLMGDIAGDGKSITLTWTPSVAGQPVIYYLINITGQDSSSDVSLHNLTMSLITADGPVQSVTVQVAKLSSVRCVEVSVTAVNEKGVGTSTTNTICADLKEPIVGDIQDDKLSSTTIVTIVVPAVVLLVLVVSLVAIFLFILRRCRRYKQHDLDTKSDYNDKRDLDSSISVNYCRTDSVETQDSISSQLSTPRTVDSYISEHMPFRMSANGLLDPIQESPSFDERPREPSPEDGGVIWTVGPANIFEYDDEVAVPKSPITALDPTSVGDSMVYTDNAAYYSVSHEPPSKPAGIKIISDNKSDGKEIVILPEKR